MAFLSTVLALLVLVLAGSAAPILGNVEPRNATATPVRRSDLPLATGEHYRASAGHMVGDTLVASFDIQHVRWQPQGVRAAELTAYAFTEPGSAPRVPGPMLRVHEGGVIRLTLRNSLDRRAVVRGLQPRPVRDNAFDSLVVMPGRDTTVVIRAGAAGSYFYWGRTTPTVDHSIAPIPGDLYGGEKEEGPFVGALIVDRAGDRPDPRERTMVITRWLDEKFPRLNDPVDWKMMVNGESFPATENFSYAVGDTVHWRVINASLTSHPMHLHGFYFRVLSHGGVSRDSTFAVADQRLAVTELLQGGESMRIAWVPERPGNWLFHCHLVRHMTGAQQLPVATGGPSMDAVAAPHAAEGHEHGMNGLVLGITVRAARGADSAKAERYAAGEIPMPKRERDIRLFAQSRPGVFGSHPGYSFVVQRGAEAPAMDSIVRPTPTLVLKRGEPVRITVLNRIAVPLAVHWHGMELESWYDGVGGFSGMPGKARAAIPARDSFVVRFTPPRSGTFMFHTHDEPGQELASGLYGALLVVDDPVRRDETRDHVLLLATRGPTDSGLVAVNGSASPAPIIVGAGEAHRIRLASISSNEQIAVELMRGDSVLTWRVLSRDGADVAASQRRPGRARMRLSAGMTGDVEVRLPAGDGYAVRITMKSYEAFEYSGSVVKVPILVRE